MPITPLKIIITYLSLSVFATQAHSQDCQNIPEGAKATKDKSGLLCNDGVRGFWFPEVSAKKMLADLQQYQVNKKLVERLETRVRISDNIEKKLLEQLDTEERISTQWRELSETQQKSLRKRQAWYKSPTLWFAIGFVTATAAGYGVAQLYARTQ